MPHNCYFPTGKTLDDSPGLAILVTCDYEGTEQSESTLPCTREDAVEMKKTFDFFNYVVHQLLNPAKADITALLTEVTDSLMTYNAEKAEGGKVIIFAFSGQGSSESEGDVIYANNGEPLNLIDEIVLPLVRHKAVFHVPKLFFIDACRGHMKLDEVISVGAFKCVGGNYRIDYSTLPRHFSYVSSCGSSLWMSRLAQALREQNDSLQDIARKVKNDVYLKQGKKQLPDSDDYLRGPLYLQKQ